MERAAAVYLTRGRAPRVRRRDRSTLYVGPPEPRHIVFLRDQEKRRSYISGMTTLRFDIPDDKAKALEEAAEKLGISLEEFLQASVDDTLQRFDADFESAAERVLKRNAELYRRLA